MTRPGREIGEEQSSAGVAASVGSLRAVIRRNFGWSLAGNATYNLSQWLMIVFLARLTGPGEVGRFALMLALSAPIFLTVGMNMATLQATDAARRWRMREYLVLRHILNVISIVVTVAIGALIGLHGIHLVELSLVGLAKCVEALSQTFFGLFQQVERLDLVARGLLVRSVTGPGCFALGVAAGGHLIWGCLGLSVGWLVPHLASDRPGAHRVSVATGIDLGYGKPVDYPAVRRLAWIGAPLGVDQGVSSLAINSPRYAVASIAGTTALGVFTSLAYLAQAVQMVTSSLAVAMIGRLAIYHHRGQRRAFSRLLGRLVGFGLALSAVAVFLAAALGDEFLKLTLGQKYADERLLVALCVGSGAITLQRAICKGIEAGRRFRSYVVVDAITTVTVAVASVVWVRHSGIVGGAYGLIVGFLVGSVVALVVVVDIVRKLTPPADALS